MRLLTVTQELLFKDIQRDMRFSPHRRRHSLKLVQAGRISDAFIRKLIDMNENDLLKYVNETLKDHERMIDNS